VTERKIVLMIARNLRLLFELKLGAADFLNEIAQPAVIFFCPALILLRWRHQRERTTRRMAAATFSTLRPPAKIIREVSAAR